MSQRSQVKVWGLTHCSIAANQYFPPGKMVNWPPFWFSLAAFSTHRYVSICDHWLGRGRKTWDRRWNFDDIAIKILIALSSLSESYCRVHYRIYNYTKSNNWVGKEHIPSVFFTNISANRIGMWKYAVKLFVTWIGYQLGSDGRVRHTREGRFYK